MEISTSSSNSGRSCIAQGLAGLVGIVFVAVTVVILIALPTEAQIFNPSVYKRAIASQDLYERLPSLLATVPLSSSDDPDNDARYLTSADLEVISKEMLSPEQAQALLEEMIDQTLAYFNSTDPKAKIQVSLVDLKARLKGESGDRIMRQIIASWPPCTEAQNQTWREVMTSDSAEMPECSPSQDILDEVTPKLGQALDEMVTSIPDMADMTPKYIPTPGATEQDPRPTLRVIRWVVRLSPLIPAALLALVTVLVVRSRKSFFGWWGALFLSVGIATFLLAALSGLMVEGLIQSIVDQAVTQKEAGAELIAVILEIVRHVLRGTGIQISILAGLSGFMGLVLVVLAFTFGGSKAGTSDPYSTMPR